MRALIFPAYGLFTGGLLYLKHFAIRRWCSDREGET
jgi:hypothetical protein